MEDWDFALKRKVSFVCNELKTGDLPYISLFYSSFGPNFYGSSVKLFFNDGSSGWVNTKTLCPTINNQYAGVLADSSNVTWCFQLVDEPDVIIGKVIDGELIINNAPNISPDYLIEKLEGICSKDNCEYQSKCLGGCRSTSIAFAQKQNPDRTLDELLYSGMPLCITNILSKNPDLRKELGYKYNAKTI